MTMIITIIIMFPNLINGSGTVLLIVDLLLGLNGITAVRDTVGRLVIILLRLERMIMMMIWFKLYTQEEEHMKMLIKH